MRSWLWSQLPILVFLFWLAAVPLLLTSGFSFYEDSLESSFVCDGLGCVPDDRSWARRNTRLLSFTTLTLVGAVATSVLVLRRPGRRSH